MARPPVTPTSEARDYPRHELFASVELRHGEGTFVLPARNISLSGLYLAARGERLGKIDVGQTVEVTVFDALESSTPALRAVAQVVRNEGQGIGLSWVAADPELCMRVTSLLERLGTR